MPPPRLGSVSQHATRWPPGSFQPVDQLAIPGIGADLEPTSAQLLWIIDIYGLFVAGSLITMGTLGDRIGRRKLLMIGATALGATSLLAAFAPRPSP